MAKKEQALKKRQQIDTTHQLMFMTVAVSAFIFGFAVVASIFLIKKINFKSMVISEKDKTYQNLVQNNKNLNKLETEVVALQTNDALRSVRLDDNNALNVVLDALPAVGNSNALGASLKDKILNVPELRIDNISVASTVNEVADASSSSSSQVNTSNPISFSFKISGEIEMLNTALKNLERSIRPMLADSIQFEINTGDQRGSIIFNGHSFYEPELKAELGSKDVEARR